jgi:hypothetical protein
MRSSGFQGFSHASSTTEDRPMHRAADAALRNANEAHSIDHGSSAGIRPWQLWRYRLLGSAVS